MSHCVEIFLSMAVITGLCSGCGTRTASHPATASALASSESDNLVHMDLRAIGHPIWIAYPQGRMPDDPFVLRRYLTDAAQIQPSHQSTNILDLTPSSQKATGTSDEIAAAAIRHESLSAIRIVQGTSYDEYPSVLRLKEQLRRLGWKEVKGRPGLFVRASRLIESG